MRIAQVSPLYESVPPQLYGGTERVVSYLTEELVRQGNEVTLYASGDSVTSARLVSACPRSLRLDEACRDPLAHHIAMIERVAREADRYDIVHWHVDYLHYPVSRLLEVAHVTTLHGRLDLPDLPALYRLFDDLPVVSISDAQRAPLPGLSWRATVHHGIPPGLHTCRDRPGSYLAFLGRVSPEKGLDHAIEIAGRAGIDLRIAAKVDRADREYYEQVIRPLLDRPGIEFIGEISEEQKDAFLGNALALLFPIEWPEPFGLVLIESMACGTPVVAFRRGSVSEIVEEGITGFAVATVDEALAALQRVPAIDRRRCRAVFEERFSAVRMTRDYTRLYEELYAERISPAVAVAVS